MTASPVWSGDIEAKNPAGSGTGIILKKGDPVTITASGWIKRGKEAHTLAGPQGVAGKNDDKVALRGRIGNVVFDVGNGIVNFPAPAEGELILFVQDGAKFYGDNSGSFQAQVYPGCQENSEQSPDEQNTEQSPPLTGDLTHGKGDICDRAPEIINTVNTLASTLKNLLESCGPVPGRCRCRESQAASTPEPTPMPGPKSGPEPKP